jgi:hypothetical protein
MVRPLLTIYIFGVIILFSLTMAASDRSNRKTFKIFILSVIISLFSWIGIYYMFKTKKL